MSIITSSLALDANGLLIAVNNRYTPEYYRTIARPYLDASGLFKAKGFLEPDDPRIHQHAPYVSSVGGSAPLVTFKTLPEARTNTL